ncbi:rho family-interacting cell polarization regulator 1 isoform X1 [Takifugu flavidus]|uniref:rho family-interacting cell polarization regulator 1 isoform X1 n=2 Tax=Takifugu flavidus TaxID=433684 RepID=UPI002544A75E|nr:rho family-interacting cell polarization regulator 1 isoform X1 [Takifugu flavidus]
MYSGYGGGPSRALSTMSLSVRPIRRPTSRSITRSQSFTGVNSNDKLPYRSLAVFSSPGLNRKPSRASRMFTMSVKPNPPPKVPQPERLGEVYQSLKKGLQSYLQVHQMDLDNLSRQMKESKRNSRLGFLYELDKQVKVTERFIRRLEFHLSKVEELYETYCLQRRLRDGANKMVKAFTSSPGSKEAKESLAEANRGYKEYTENMCVLENDLESHLGEFHIRMKGLAGFARLCAGDQYEIFMKYGRQRWKLRGRIEINAKQEWDSEEMVFLPLVSEFLSIKVTELKSLASHVVVGSVSCETKDLFAALPQMVAVDINDLGTIKLSLEVTWNPFDKDEQVSTASSVSRAPTVSKRFSTIFNQSPPDTPSLREQAFYSLPRSLTRRQHWPLLDVFRDTISQSCSCSDGSPARHLTANLLRHHEVLENGTAWSNSSESSDDSSSPQLSAGGLCKSINHKNVIVTPEVQPVVSGGSSSQLDISACTTESSSSTPTSLHSVRVPGDGPRTQPTDGAREEEKSWRKGPASAPAAPAEPDSHRSQNYSRSLSHISEGSIDGALLMTKAAPGSQEEMSLSSGMSVSDIEMEISSRTPEPASDPDPLPRRLSFSQETPTRPAEGGTKGQQDEQKQATPPSDLLAAPAATQEVADVTYVARCVAVEEEQVGADERDAVVDSGLEEALGAVVSSLDDYRGQFPELQLLEDELKLLQVTLKGGEHGRATSMVSLTVETALGSFDFLNASDWEEEEEENHHKHHSNRSQQERGWDSPSCPLTTGCPALDRTLVVHLKNCGIQLLRLGTFGPLRCGEMFALDRLLREVRVLQVIGHLIEDRPTSPRRPNEVIPQLDRCEGAVSLWQRCVGGASVYSTCAEKFLDTLSEVYAAVLSQGDATITDAVCLCLVERILDRRLPRRGINRDGPPVTLFQVWTYLDANNVSDLDTHMSELAKEVQLVHSLASSDQDVIVQTLKHPAECSLRKEGLGAVVKLLKDPRGKVSASASSVLRGLSAQPRQREQALVSCLELLEHDSVDTRVCACKALACLRAKESIDQLVYVCRTDKEDVREAAKQALLVLGEEGKMAYRHVETSQDTIPRFFAAASMASTAF